MFRFSLCFSVFSIVQAGAAPLMTTIAFIAMTFTDKFDIANAFTTLMLFQFMSFVIMMLPMLLSFISQASISSQRLGAFITLPERDPGVIVNVDQLDPEQRSKLSDIVSDDDAIKVVGKPSFIWNLAVDQIVPPVLDPFSKINETTVKTMQKTLPSIKAKYQASINKYASRHSIVVAGEVDMQQPNEKEIAELKRFDAEVGDEKLVDQWCDQFDLPPVSRLQNLEQYNVINYEKQ